jgi:hypothetical protein
MGGLTIGTLVNQENKNPIGEEDKHQSIKDRWRIQIIQKDLIDSTG